MKLSKALAIMGSALADLTSTEINGEMLEEYKRQHDHLHRNTMMIMHRGVEYHPSRSQKIKRKRMLARK